MSSITIRKQFLYGNSLNVSGYEMNSTHRSVIVLSSAVAESSGFIEIPFSFFIKKGMFSEC